jgi:hypothetical protein
MAEIQKLRKRMDCPTPRRTLRRSATSSRRWRRKMEMPVRDFEEENLCGRNAVPERTAERDDLLGRLKRKKAIDPILREFEDDEIFGDTAIEDRTKERDDLKQVVPLESQIQRLRKQLEMPVREWEVEDMAGPNAVRSAHRNATIC